ncbi:MAG TPA: MlaD family protein [Thermoleophilaceae bacterium]|nr:MlaD family protein [Thermoleophilaceae bacterium]
MSRLSPFKTGVLVIIVIAVACFFAFNPSNPLSKPYELHALFHDANSIKARSPVRIAGVDVGKVTKIEPVEAGSDAARVTMEIQDKGLPIHRDAQLKIRPRIFLEGNFFVDLQPGSPSEPELESASTVPTTQTASPVQFGEVLNALQSDTREDLQTFLREYSLALSGKGAAGFNESIPFWKPAYRDSAIASEATLGLEPDRDIQRILRGQARTFGALAADEGALQRLVVNLNTTTAALAREDVALEASIPELRDTLEAAMPSLASLNASFPALRAFAADALPGVESSDETLAAGVPFIQQLSALVSPEELGGAAEALRSQTPALVALTEGSIPLLEQARALSACTNNVLVPFSEQKIPNPDEPENDNQEARLQFGRGFVGLSGESRLADATNQFFHAGLVFPGNRVRPGPPPDGGDTPPPHRPDVPCETQELPDLHAPGGPISAFPVIAAATSGRQPLAGSRTTARPRAFVRTARELRRGLDRVFERRAER